jgi:hypothetical protein
LTDFLLVILQKKPNVSGEYSSTNHLVQVKNLTDINKTSSSSYNIKQMQRPIVTNIIMIKMMSPHPVDCRHNLINNENQRNNKLPIIYNGRINSSSQCYFSLAEGGEPHPPVSSPHNCSMPDDVIVVAVYEIIIIGIILIIVHGT